MEAREAQNIVAYWLRWLLNEDVPPAHVYDELKTHMDAVIAEFIGPTTDDFWEDLRKYSISTPQPEKDEIMAMIQRFQLARISQQWQSDFNRSVVLISTILLSKNGDELHYFLVKMSDNTDSLCRTLSDAGVSRTFCMEFMKIIMNERKGPLPEFFDGYILKGPSVNRSFEERETSRRLSVSEELLNLTNQSQQRRQKEHHEKRQLENLKARADNAEEENKELLAENSALKNMSETQESEIRLLKTQLAAKADYAEVKKSAEKCLEEKIEIQERNRVLEHCAKENEVLKTRCDKYLQMRNDYEEKAQIATETLEQHRRQDEQFLSEIAEKSDAILKLREVIEELKSENQEASDRISELERNNEKNRSFNRSVSMSSDHSFPSLVPNAIPFEVECQLSNLKNEVEEKKSKLLEKNSEIDAFKNQIKNLVSEKAEILKTLEEKQSENLKALQRESDKTQKLESHLGTEIKNRIESEQQVENLKLKVTQLSDNLQTMIQSEIDFKEEKHQLITSLDLAKKEKFENMTDLEAEKTLSEKLENEIAQIRSELDLAQSVKNEIISSGKNQAKILGDKISSLESLHREERSKFLRNEAELTKALDAQKKSSEENLARISDLEAQQKISAQNQAKIFEEEISSLKSIHYEERSKFLKNEAELTKALDAQKKTSEETLAKCDKYLQMQNDLEEKAHVATEALEQHCRQKEQFLSEIAEKSDEIVKLREVIAELKSENQVATDRMRSKFDLAQAEKDEIISSAKNQAKIYQDEISSLKSRHSEERTKFLENEAELTRALDAQKKSCEENLARITDLEAQQKIYESGGDERSKKLQGLLDESRKKNDKLLKKEKKITAYAKQKENDYKTLYERSEKRKETHAAEIEQIESDRNRLRSENEKIESDRVHFRSEIEKLKADLGKNMAKQKELGKDLALANCEKEDAKTEQEKLQKLKEIQGRSLEQKNEEIQMLKDELAKNEATFKSEIERLQQENDDLKAKLDDESGSIANSSFVSMTSTSSRLPKPKGSSTIVGLSEENVRRHNESSVSAYSGITRFGSSTPKPHDKTGYVQVAEEPDEPGNFEGISSLMGFKKKGSYDFDPSLHEDKKQEAFRYQKREEDFRSKRNSKLPKHLQSSYALETDSPNPSFKLPEAPKVGSTREADKENVGSKRKSRGGSDEIQKPAKNRRRSLRSFLPGQKDK